MSALLVECDRPLAGERSQLTLLQARKQYDQMSDAALVIACQARNKCAFEALIKRYRRTIYGLLYQLAPDWRDTADLAQEVYIRMWRSIATLRNVSAFKSWLHQLVTNLFYDELRKRAEEHDDLHRRCPEGRWAGRKSDSRYRRCHRHAR